MNRLDEKIDRILEEVGNSRDLPKPERRNTWLDIVDALVVCGVGKGESRRLVQEIILDLYPEEQDFEIHNGENWNE